MPVLQLTAAEVDLDTGRVVRATGDLARLTSTERALLVWLSEHPDRDLPRDRLLAAVWGYAEGVSSRTLDTTIKTLRRKVETDSQAPDHIHTVWGVGYRFTASVPVARTTPSPDLTGRDLLVGSVAAALGAGRRLVSLVGPGGAGKTRLAREVCAGACFVSLAEVTDRAGLERAVALELDLAGPLVARLGALRGPLVLDNFEQLVDEGRPAVVAWLDEVPGLQVVVTSRRPLRVPDELIVEVGPLGRAHAIALLRRRIVAVRPAFADASEEVLGAIVDGLDGLPLAIELAAARAVVLSVDELLRRVGATGFLARTDGEERHRSVEATVQWSWDLLSESEQRALTACAAFVGRFAAGDAEAVMVDVDDPLAALERLFDASLLTRTDDGRLGVLQIIRRFAEARAVDPVAIRVRHAERILAVLEGPGQQKERAADLHAIVSGLPERPDLQVRAALAASRLYRTIGLAEARLGVSVSAVAAAERLGSVDLLADARGEWAAARLAVGLSTFEDHLLVLQDARRTGDPIREAYGLAHLGTFHRLRGQMDLAEQRLGEAIALHEAAGGAPDRLGLYLLEVGMIERLAGRPHQAIVHYERALERYRAAGDPVGIAHTMQRLGLAHHCIGESALAVHWLERSRAEFEAHGAWAGVLVSRAALAWLALEAGEVDRAATLLEDCLSHSARATPFHRALIHGHFAVACLERGDLVAARRHDALALEIRQGQDDFPSAMIVSLFHAMVSLAGGTGEPTRRALDRAVACGRVGASCPELVFALGYRSLVSDDPEADIAEAEAIAARIGDHAANLFVALLRRSPERRTDPDPEGERWLHPRRLRQWWVEASRV